jgi:hypothetical protein
MFFKRRTRKLELPLPPQREAEGVGTGLFVHMIHNNLFEL